MANKLTAINSNMRRHFSGTILLNGIFTLFDRVSNTCNIAYDINKPHRITVIVNGNAPFNKTFLV